MRCPRGYDPCKHIGCSCPIESRPIENVNAELEAAGVDLPALERETERTLKLLREKLDLQARLDRVTELVEAWVPALEHLQELIDNEAHFTTNVPGGCALAFKQALKGEEA